MSECAPVCEVPLLFCVSGMVRDEASPLHTERAARQELCRGIGQECRKHRAPGRVQCLVLQDISLWILIAPAKCWLPVLPPQRFLPSRAVPGEATPGLREMGVFPVLSAIPG